MDIVAENLGKRFNREWIFKNLSQVFRQNSSYAITGPNGSGKSTLLQVLSGIIPCSSGTLWYEEGGYIQKDNLHKYIAITTPYQELIEELTLYEFLQFHLRFKGLKKGMQLDEFSEKLSLNDSLHKEIRNYSSGMKQKVKLGLSLYAETPIIFLDEPTTNLDSKGIDWYLNEIQVMKKDVMLLICSNQEYEYSFCEFHLQMEAFK